MTDPLAALSLDEMRREVREMIEEGDAQSDDGLMGPDGLTDGLYEIARGWVKRAQPAATAEGLEPGRWDDDHHTPTTLCPICRYAQEQLTAPAEGLREALEAVAKERARQDAKWGEQSHDATVWLTVLTEEVGELADAILSRRALLADGYRIGPAVEAMRNEAVQVAAVAVAFIEWMDRGAPTHENAAAETAAVEIAHHTLRAALKDPTE